MGDAGKIYRLVFHSMDQGASWHANLAFEEYSVMIPTRMNRLGAGLNRRTTWQIRHGAGGVGYKHFRYNKLIMEVP